jgi:hypothetical protein
VKTQTLEMGALTQHARDSNRQFWTLRRPLGSGTSVVCLMSCRKNSSQSSSFSKHRPSTFWTSCTNPSSCEKQAIRFLKADLDHPAPQSLHLL